MGADSLLYALVLCASLLAQHGAAKEAQSEQASATLTTAAGNAKKASQLMFAAPLTGPEALLSLGYKGGAEAGWGRNWRRLAEKLATPGSRVTLVTFGGSVTSAADHGGSWVEVLASWMRKAFPRVHIQVINLARAGTDVTAAALCWWRYVPNDSDLVIIEYSANGCGHLQCTSVASPMVAHYESLIRRLIKKAPSAALMSFAIFSFLTWSMENDSVNLPQPYYNTGQEMHSMLARRYRMPMVSARDALYDIIWDEAALKRQLGVGYKDIIQDHIHPTKYGAQLYGSLVGYAMRFILSKELATISNVSKRSTAIKQMPMPSPICPAAREADGITICSEGAHLQQKALATDGWMWTGLDAQSELRKERSTKAVYPRMCTSPGCKKILGFRYTAGKQSGKYLDFTVDTTQVSASDRLDKRALVIFFTKSFKEGSMGTASVSCVSGCSCESMELGGAVEDYPSLLSTGTTEVTEHPECVVRLEVLDKGPDSGSEFEVNGVAVIPFSDQVPLTPIDKDALERGMWNSK